MAYDAWKQPSSLCPYASNSKKYSSWSTQRTGRTLTPWFQRSWAVKEFNTRSTHVSAWDKQRKCTCLHRAIYVHHPAQWTSAQNKHFWLQTSTTQHMPLKELNCSSCTLTDLLKLMCYGILSVPFFLTRSSKFVASKLHSVKYCKENSILCFLSLFVWVLFSHFSSFSMIGTFCLRLKDLQIILQSQTSSFPTVLYHSRQQKIRHLL